MPQQWPDPLPEGIERRKRDRTDPAWAAAKRHAIASLVIGVALIVVALICLKVTV